MCHVQCEVSHPPTALSFCSVPSKVNCYLVVTSPTLYGSQFWNFFSMLSMEFHTVLDLENSKDRIFHFIVQFLEFSRDFRALQPVKKWKYPLTFDNLWPRGCEPPLYLFLGTFSPLVSLRHPLLQLLHLELEGTRGCSHSEKTGSAKSFTF